MKHSKIHPPVFEPVILIDHRESFPWSFTGIKADYRDGYQVTEIRTERVQLLTGDYSLESLENKIAVERKSLDDLYSTFSQRRDQFEAEIARLNEMEAAAVVIEANWRRIIQGPVGGSRLHPKSVVRTIIAWQQRYRGVAWLTLDSRRMAELVAFRFLQRYWLDQADAKADIVVDGDPARMLVTD